MPDNSLTSAQSLGVLDGKSVIRRNSLNRRDRVDYFKFTLNRSSNAKFNLTGLRANADLALLNRTGRVVARSNKGGNKAEKLQRQLAAGTYYLQVSGKGGSTSYKLKSSAVTTDSGGGTPPLPARNRLVSFINGRSERPAASLASVDLNTGVVTPIPTTGDAALLPWGDIAVFGNEGYFLTLNSLQKIDLTTRVTSTFPNNVFNNQVVSTLGFTTSGELYATSGLRTFSEGVKDWGGFYKVDIANQRVDLVAQIPGFNGIGDIAYDPGSGRFFATSTGADGFDQLYSIGLSGDAILIGNTGYQGNAGSAAIGGLIVDGGTLYGFTGNGEQLVINTTTGAATLDKKLTLPNSFNPGVTGGA